MIVLIVDDDEGTLVLRSRQFRDAAERAGEQCDVRVARSLSEAREQMVRIPPPDLILLDLIFAGAEPADAEDSLRYIKVLRECHPGVAVLVLTGSSDERLSQMAAQFGADHFAKKQHTISQSKLFAACMSAFRNKGGQAMLDNLNLLLASRPA